MKFNELNLSQELQKAIIDLNYNEATYIQAACIPIILNGGDVIGQSQTGTGKTAAFGLPVVEMLEPGKSKKCKVLILSPTRELAVQVSEEIRKFSKYKEGIKTVAIFGGAPITKQILELRKGCDIVVGTPGRVLDHIGRKTLRLEECKTLILDEADEMLNMGFREDIESVLNSIDDNQRQTILFSATMPKEILDITHLYQTNPMHVKTPQSEVSAATIEQVYYEVNQSDKRQVIMQLLQINNNKLSMVFCNTKKMVDDLCADLVSKGYSAAAIHGDMKQEMRMAVLKKFKQGKLTVLICTDVAARGLDIQGMDIVYNYDFPQEDEYYIHRIGRCGRAGKEGKSITLITPRQRRLIKNIEYKTKAKVAKVELPSGEEMKEIRFNQIETEINSLMTTKVPAEIATLLAKIVEKGEISYERIAEVLTYQLIGEDLFKEVRRPRDASSLKVTQTGFSTIRLDVGNKVGVKPAHFVGAIAEASGVDGGAIGKIQIEDSYSLVDIPSQYEEEIIKSLKNTTIKNYEVHVTKSDVSAGGRGGNGASRGGSSSRSRSSSSRGSSDRSRSSSSRGSSDRSRSSSSRGSSDRSSSSRSSSDRSSSDTKRKSTRNRRED
jgi:ATP-dependent RNA helicase DeaD